MKVRHWIYFIAGFLVFWLILSCLIEQYLYTSFTIYGDRNHDQTFICDQLL